MTVEILGVHGINNFKEGSNAADFANQWTKHLRSGFVTGRAPHFHLGFAYYAPALHLTTAQGGQGLDQLTPRQRDGVWAWLIASGLPSTVVQGRAAKPLRQAVQWLAAHRGLDQRWVEWFISRFITEIDVYFALEHITHRQEAGDIVGAAIDGQQPTIILAHSLGSVVTYEALWRDPGRQVQLLVTMGSPLAMPTVVYQRLNPAPPAGSPAPKPPGVKHWINIADPGDIIAIPRPLSKHFDGIDVELEPSIHPIDAHLVKHYLRSPTTAAIIAASIV